MRKQTWLFLTLTLVTTSAYVIRRDVIKNLSDRETTQYTNTSIHPNELNAVFNNPTSREEISGVSVSESSPQFQRDDGKHMMAQVNRHLNISRDNSVGIAFANSTFNIVTNSVKTLIIRNKTENTPVVVAEMPSTSGGNGVKMEVLLPVLCVVFFAAFVSFMSYLCCQIYVRDDRGVQPAKTKFELVPMGQFHHEFFIGTEDFVLVGCKERL
ncbi:hypothetical protein V1264_003066 [Littorina saxatilis]|uniref:Uncharacterized protein n=1 Tax=Littorina saxatilis TaxID=31220 RepID=A0AAN9B4M0_9CAEN